MDRSSGYPTATMPGRPSGKSNPYPRALAIRKPFRWTFPATAWPCTASISSRRAPSLLPPLASGDGRIRHEIAHSPATLLSLGGLKSAGRSFPLRHDGEFHVLCRLHLRQPVGDLDSQLVGALRESLQRQR